MAPLSYGSLVCLHQPHEVWYYHRLLVQYKVLDPSFPMFEEYKQHPRLLQYAVFYFECQIYRSRWPGIRTAQLCFRLL